MSYGREGIQCDQTWGKLPQHQQEALMEKVAEAIKAPEPTEAKPRSMAALARKKFRIMKGTR